MSERMVGWLSVRRMETSEGEDGIELTLSVGSFEGPLVINIDAGDWSRMLAAPNLPVAAEVRFLPKHDTPA
jgi:hypothetical protein